ncbi:lactose/L-arabinose transport system permease protein [Caldalkalibacillus uzonensis]|uniref:Lactose/L-arabinose transport system permease protein n=1 Tax=Caldalkalibacillus uzonensis TaxID=353224 RepID=A0ABU0CT16_9BACI|nr:carbohydrate ABC transporter permease [Caldalkalibacillus uzonensis]MDQ0338640.1 lactose/L-arabinose transport system permease protein [Caldalkalibacillus uzonensis]
MHMRQEFNKLLLLIVAMVGVTISIFPFYWMFTASTLTESQIFKVPPTLVPGTNFFENLDKLQNAWPVWKALFNSIFVSGITTVTTVFFSALAGFAFAKYQFKGRELLFFAVLLIMMVPTQVMLVPMFIIMMNFDWIDTYYALIIPFLVTPFGVFLMRQQMLGFPTELIEAARIDGCKDLGIFFKIVLPTMKPACAALGIVTFMQQWGNFIWPLVVINSREMYTLPLMLAMMVQPGQVVQYGPVMVGAVLGLIPMLLLFLLFQKHFVSGVFSGSVKG